MINSDLTALLLQELEDQLQEEEDKVSHLNKVKSKLEQQIDEVRCFPNWQQRFQLIIIYYLVEVFSFFFWTLASKSCCY